MHINPQILVSHTAQIGLKLVVILLLASGVLELEVQNATCLATIYKFCGGNCKKNHQEKNSRVSICIFTKFKTAWFTLQVPREPRLHRDRSQHSKKLLM